MWGGQIVDGGIKIYQIWCWWFSSVFENLRLFSDDALDELQSFSKLKSLDMKNDILEKTMVEATPPMRELSLLINAASHIDEPFLLAIVGYGMTETSGIVSVEDSRIGVRYSSSD
ncbi:unnamed protein product [Dovyalis caffra]|uniref:Uncharacterized protein n=1 Tax=Dovyalis caffra TaxID=77055 RepID=A0AAV1SNM0_9ROSI|nr:unnamed protein product [Dovyalis caffra]